MPTKALKLRFWRRLVSIKQQWLTVIHNGLTPSRKTLMNRFRSLFVLVVMSLLTGPVAAESLAAAKPLDLTLHWVGFFALGVFLLAYLVVVLEEVIELRKSKPMMLAAALIWVAIAIVYKLQGMSEVAEQAIRHDVLEYSELLLFLIVSIAYVNAMDERGVFNSLRAWLINLGFTYRQLFWVTGFLAFFISSVSNNMTTAMLMCAVVMAVGKDDPKFVGVSCVNTVVAANAGGAFCPFGDITTLMVWQKGILDFWAFFVLFVPSLLNFVIPAAIMHFAIPKRRPKPLDAPVTLQRGARRIVLLFLLTILTAVAFENFLRLPAAVGMMAGFTYLQFFSYFMQMTHPEEVDIPLSAAVMKVQPDRRNQARSASMCFTNWHRWNGTPCCSSTASFFVSAGSTSSAI